MPFVGHLPEIFFLLLLALIVFGPKRMIEMGSSLGKAVRELRDQVKDIPGLSGVANLGGLLGDDEPRSTPFSAMSQFSQSIGAELYDEPPAPVMAPPTEPGTLDGMVAPNGTGPIIDGTIAGTIEPADPADPAEPRPTE